MAYVSVSRGAHDAQIFTSDREKLPEALSRDVSHQSAHVLEVSQEPAKAAQQEVAAEKPAKPTEKIYTWAEHLRHWTPLNGATTPEEAKQFAWKAETGTVQTYQHMQTGRYIHIDGSSGQFFNQDQQEIGAKQALEHAMPPGQEHSHSNEIKIEKNIGYGLSL